MYSIPFYTKMEEMLVYVRDCNFERLANNCDDDFEIMDINTNEVSEIIQNREDRENCFFGLFAQLKV